VRREASRVRHGHFNLIHRESARGRISVAPPEYVILRKLQYYGDSASERHLRDIAMIHPPDQR